MSKKMLKRSLVLGALMAFVITGQAWAREINIEESSDQNGLKGVDYSNTQNLVLTDITSVSVKNTGTRGATGVNLENKSSATLGAITINATSTSANGFGFRLMSGTETNDGVNTYSGNTVLVNGDAIITANGADYAQGIYSQYSDVTFAKNVTINATSTGDYAYAVRMLGDTDSEASNFTNSKVTFNGDSTNLNAKSEKYAWGIITSGGNEGAGAYFNGKEVKIDVEAGSQAVGVHTQYGTGAIASSVDTSVNINTKSANGYAYGIATDLYAGEVAGKVDFNGNVTVVADGNWAYGIESVKGSSVGLGSEGKIVTITATANEGRAYGIYGDGGADIDLADATITATSEESRADGVYAGANANITASGDLTVTAKGKAATHGVYAYNGGEISLGNEDSKIEINAETETSESKQVMGIRAYSQSEGTYSKINILADELNINSKVTGDGWAHGVYSASGGDENKAVSDININANKTTITVEAEEDGKANAITAFSSSNVTIEGDLEATADNVICTRGNANIVINENGSGTVNLNGDIFYNRVGEEKIDANVFVNLTDTESSFTGAVIVENGTKEDISGMTIGLSNGAAWNVTGDSFVNNLTVANGATVNMVNEDGESMSIDVGNLAGDGGIVTTDNLENKMNVGETGEGFASLTVQATGEAANKIASATGDAQTAMLQSLADVVATEGDTTTRTSVATIVGTVEGEVAGAITAEVGNDGKITSVTEATNTVNDSIGEASVALKAHWRAHMNDMNKRMGELRNANGEHGVWTRMVRGEAEYEGVKAQYNQYQLGYDEKLSVDKRWTVGAAVTFAEGDSSFGNGSTEDDSTAFAIYGSKLNNDGTYVDLIARYAHLESDVTVDGINGDYSTNGMSVSAEFGKRIQQGKGFWIEPQVELSYGTVDSAEYMLDGKQVQVGDMDSIIGRVGFSLGKDIKQGNVYARASYLYDFDGETETSFSKNGLSRTIEEDLGGGWWEVGVGANINLSKATYIYADVEKTFGGEVDTNWQWNLGVRYSF